MVLLLNKEINDFMDLEFDINKDKKSINASF